MRRTITILAAGLTAAITAAVPASAHVTAQPPEQPAGGFTTVTFRVPNERPEPTNQVQVQFPESILSARVKPVAGWSHEIEMIKLDEPVEGGHGEQHTERVGSITWSGGAIQADEFQEFTVSLQMPTEGELDDLLFFPATQTYEGGEVVRWIQKPESADSDAELERPAPKVTLVEAGGGHGHGADDEHADEVETDPASSSDAVAEEDLGPLWIVAIAALAIGLISLLLGWRHARRAGN